MNRLSMNMPHSPDNLTLDFSGHIHNLGDLQTRLGLAGHNVQSTLQAAWRRWGTSLAEHLVGDYALASIALHSKFIDPVKPSLT